MPRWDGDNEALRKAVHWALLDAFLVTCKKNMRGAAIAPPDDFVRVGAELQFRAGEFSDKVAEFLLMRGFAVDASKVDDEKRAEETGRA